MYSTQMTAHRKDKQAARPTALYIHVPFCRQKCDYCDFYSLPLAACDPAKYLAAIAAEKQLHASTLQIPLTSVFIGGGTPTALDAEDLSVLLAPLIALTDEHTEFSVEANPGTLTPRHLAVLRQAGVNRINLGVQSFIDRELQAAGRIHSAAQARQAFLACRQAGFDNLGLDLILALPEQTPESWEESLIEALALSPSHVSCYALSVESDTPLGRRAEAGEFSEMPDDVQRELYYRTIDILADAGLEQYEISNFARAGRECRHNLTYWHNEPYLGLGPAAASYIAGERRVNTPDLDVWMAALDAGQHPPAESEALTGRAHLAETVMLELRLQVGVDRAAFRQRFGCDVVETFATPIHHHLAMGNLTVTDEYVRLTPWALFIANTVLADIVADAGEPT
jgi:oxygen-independent coproporphyrinogen-3 oxidase